ncbi:hypothetical protein ONZ45_g10215 [Pleurotus djamor]|nr:hypothetical protein ONZ45_g10215 [Pleurotus djamor]
MTPTTTSKYIVPPRILLSTAQVSSGAGSVLTSTPVASVGKGKLLSTGDPLSIPITTVNSRRFVPRVGPVFWLRDRVAEILLWKRGWKVTCTWMAAYEFLCVFPRLVFVVPHAIVLAVMLANSPPAPQPKPPPHPTFLAPPPPTPKSKKIEESASKTPVSLVPEGSKEWLANIQGIYNLMGFGYVYMQSADVHDRLAPISSQLNLSPEPSESSQLRASSFYIFTAVAVTLPPLGLLVVSPYFPTRLVALIGGLTPFSLLHPRILPYLPLLPQALQEVFILLTEASHSTYAKLQPWISNKLASTPYISKLARFPTPSPKLASIKNHPIRHLCAFSRRLVDNDRLSDDVCGAELRQVEKYENERWKLDEASPSLGLESSHIFDSGTTETGSGSWSKKHLKEGERCRWTRGRDGWSGVGDGGFVSSNLTFSLASGWNLVDTEDWREDVVGEWTGGLIDDDGWTYTNDVWSDPRPYPVYKASPDIATATVTRRRRWTRCIWYKGVSPH